MTLEKAYFIVKSVIDKSHDERIHPLFVKEKEIKALEVLFNVVEANLDNLESE